MDLSTIEHRVDAGYYTTIELFEADIALIKENVLRYFGTRDASGYVSRSSELVDKVQSYVHRLGPLFRAQCAEAALRVEQGEKVMPLAEEEVLRHSDEVRRSKRKHRRHGHKRLRSSSPDHEDDRGGKRMRLDGEHNPPPKNALPPLEGTGLNGSYWSRLTTLDENGNAIPAPEPQPRPSQPPETRSGSQQRPQKSVSSSSEKSGSESGSESESVEIVSGSDDMGHRQRCTVCDEVGELLCCDSCDLVYHLKCCTPALKEVPEGEWHCETCVGELCIRLPSEFLMEALKEIEEAEEKERVETKAKQSLAKEKSSKDESSLKEKSTEKEKEKEKEKEEELAVKIEDEALEPAEAAASVAGEDAMDIDEPVPTNTDLNLVHLNADPSIDPNSSPRRARSRREFGQAPQRRSQRIGEFYAERPPPQYLPPWKKSRNPTNGGQSEYAKKMEKVQQQQRARMEADAVVEDDEDDEDEDEDEEDVPEPLPPAPTPSIFDKVSVNDLRARLVAWSERAGLNVEKLMALHARLMRAVVAHRLDVDKGALIAKINEEIEDEMREDDAPIRLGGTLPLLPHTDLVNPNPANNLGGSILNPNPGAKGSAEVAASALEGDAMNLS